MCEHHEEVARPSVARRTLIRGAGGLLLGGGLVTASATAASAATSQNGWPAGYSSQIPLSRLVVGPADFPAGVRTGQVHTILGYVARRMHNEVEALVDGWCWGHAYRPISGSTTLSNHSSGTAIDINAPRHPLGAAGTFSSTQVSRIRSILSYCDGVVRWGGDYSTRKDEMHFEINVRPGDARLTTLVNKINGGSSYETNETWTTVRRGASGFRVTAIQHLLRARGYSLTVDGSFGSITESKVISFQRSRGLVADGIVGPKTWGALVITCQQGSTGQAVVAIQKLLTYRGYSLTADGSFGSITKSKVVAFQQSRRLYPDGIVGRVTWSRLTV
ncbi:peptidoglycan-binding protein [Intrasporangium sp.]|uniref:peptidoglycan-binding protein n=1 Tax=Intrasporangium sp. TaxID=1925024 RepID=UPI00293B38BD|nr:peptidoglycan-binding protein [Intrasporangium sp.]MDV3221298.1 peptidoglycan-binding protein [Intrasporangium sp.]